MLCILIACTIRNPKIYIQPDRTPKRYTWGPKLVYLDAKRRAFRIKVVLREIELLVAPQALHRRDWCLVIAHCELFAVDIQC